MTDSNGIDLSPIMAPIFFGFVVSTSLGGICILQSYIYFLSARDPWGIKVVAAITITLDVVSTCLISQAVYNYLVPHFGSLIPFGTFTIGLSIDCLVSSLITFIAQMFLARQLYLLMKSRKSKTFLCVPAVVAVGAFIAVVFGVACTAAMIKYKRSVFTNRDPRFELFFGLQKGISSLTDIIATIGLCSFLSSSRTGLSSSDSLVKLLMEFTIERGALVTIFQTVLVILFFAVPNRLYWVPVHINVTKLYANVFFAILNARGILNEKRSGIQHFSTHGQSAFKFVRTNLEEANDKPMPTVTVTESVIVSDL